MPVFAGGDNLKRVAADCGLGMGLDDEAVRVPEVGADSVQQFEFLISEGRFGGL